MIEITVHEMIDSLEVLKEISKKKMPAKTAYKFARINREIDRENNLFQETRMNLILKYGNKDENGKLEEENGNYTIAKDKINDFRQEFDGLIRTYITINADKINLDDFGEDLFSPEQIEKIDWIIEE